MNVKHTIKNIIGIGTACAVFVFIACSKQAVAQTPSSIVDVRHNPEVMKLQNVLGSLSERAKNAIPNGDPQEFLSDLYAVLEADTDDLLILCDKKHSIGKEYVPTDIVHLDPSPLYRLSRNNLSLRKPAFDALQEMAAAANKDGINFMVSSTYRSYDYQVIVYNRLVKLEGQEVADRESARPGTSQHQLGTVIDFGTIDDDYALTKDCKWLTANASKFGWSLSFPDGYEQDTGYRWECWHFRYIGKEACNFQKKWFSDIQQYMLEFIYAWKNTQ